MLLSKSPATSVREKHILSFEIGDRVRLRLHPKWNGTVVARSLDAYSIDWDNHGVETTHGNLLELIEAQGTREIEHKQVANADF